MFERIAIMGTGSLGTVLGAYISPHRKIDLIDTNVQHVSMLNQRGATVTGKAHLSNIPVRAITPEQMDGKYDLFLYMAKQTYNESCLPQMKAHSHPDTYVCCCQNGLPENAVCSYFPADHVFGAPVGWGAAWQRPGCSELTTDADFRNFSLGSVTGKYTPALHEVKHLLELMCRVEISDNLIGQRWTKLHINAAYSGLSTVMGGTFGDVSDNDLAIKWAVRIGQECVHICKASGISMLPGHSSSGDPIDFMQLYDFTDSKGEAYCIEVVKDMNSGSRALTASMLQDLLKGRACEVNSILGVVVSAGHSVNIPTPYTAAAQDIILKKQNHEIPVNCFPQQLYPKI